MPAVTGVSHVDLSVSDLDRSAAWYAQLLGAVQVLDGTNDERHFSFRYLVEPSSGMIIGLVQHQAMLDGSFTPLRAGLDHLSFAVSSRDELEAWRTRLGELVWNTTASTNCPLETI